VASQRSSADSNLRETTYYSHCHVLNRDHVGPLHSLELQLQLTSQHMYCRCLPDLVYFRLRPKLRPPLSVLQSAPALTHVANTVLRARRDTLRNSVHRNKPRYHLRLPPGMQAPHVESPAPHLCFHTQLHPPVARQEGIEDGECVVPISVFEWRHCQIGRLYCRVRRFVQRGL